MGVSIDGGAPVHHPFLDGIVHFQPSIVGYPHCHDQSGKSRSNTVDVIVAVMDGSNGPVKAEVPSMFDPLRVLLRGSCHNVGYECFGLELKEMYFVFGSCIIYIYINN